MQGKIVEVVSVQASYLERFEPAMNACLESAGIYRVPQRTNIAYDIADIDKAAKKTIQNPTAEETMINSLGENYVDKYSIQYLAQNHMCYISFATKLQS